jgi:hypothetical protein
MCMKSRGSAQRSEACPGLLDCFTAGTILYNLPGSPVSYEILRRMVVVDALSTVLKFD